MRKPLATIRNVAILFTMCSSCQCHSEVAEKIESTVYTVTVMKYLEVTFNFFFFGLVQM